MEDCMEQQLEALTTPAKLSLPKTNISLYPTLVVTCSVPPPLSLPMGPIQVILSIYLCVGRREREKMSPKDLQTNQHLFLPSPPLDTKNRSRFPSFALLTTPSACDRWCSRCSFNDFPPKCVVRGKASSCAACDVSHKLSAGNFFSL